AELLARLRGLRDALALDRAVAQVLEESLRRLCEQDQLRDVRAAGKPLELLNDETAEAATPAACDDGHRAQQSDGIKTLQGTGRYEIGSLISHDELGLRRSEVARRQPSPLEQKPDAVRVLWRRSL